MDNVTYQADAQRTKSPDFHGNLVSRAVITSRLLNAIHAMRQLDELKKALFYGRNYEGLCMDGAVEASAFTLHFHNLAVEGNLQTAYDILHAIMGKATESGELLELAAHCLLNNKQFDAVNFVEEIGDGFWYDAIGLEAVRASFAEAMARNINKLRTRFPERFVASQAINRNVDAERATLEAPSRLADERPHETAPEFLERLGTDGMKWAEEFIKITHAPTFEVPQLWDAGYLVGWFANAIEAGKTAGRAEARTV